MLIVQRRKGLGKTQRHGHEIVKDLGQFIWPTPLKRSNCCSMDDWWRLGRHRSTNEESCDHFEMCEAVPKLANDQLPRYRFSSARNLLRSPPDQHAIAVAEIASWTGSIPGVAIGVLGKAGDCALSDCIGVGRAREALQGWSKPLN